MLCAGVWPPSPFKLGDYILFPTTVCSTYKIIATCRHEEGIQISHLSEQGPAGFASVDVWLLPFRL